MKSGKTPKLILTALRESNGESVTFNKEDIEWNFFDALVFSNRVAADYLISDDAIICK